MDPFVDRVWRTIRREEMLARGEAVLVAFSGGPDSTALLLALRELTEVLTLRLAAAHFNHRLRPTADEVQTRCEQLARRLGLPFVAGGPDGLDRRAANLEHRARWARYAFLRRTAREVGCQKIATGHTLDDQAETVLLRLLRGCGIRGLSGIQPVRRDGVIRPLIDVSRSEVVAFLERMALDYDQDETNTHPRFVRNRVRAEVLPALEALNPKVRRSLARLAAAARWHSDAMATLLDEKLEQVVYGHEGLPISALRAYPRPLQLLLVRRWLEKVVPPEAHQPAFEATMNLAAVVQADSAPSHLSPERVAELLRNRGAFRGRFRDAQSAGDRLPTNWGKLALRMDGPQELPGGFIVSVARKIVAGPGDLRAALSSASPWVAVFPYDAWVEDVGLAFRPVQPGDRIDPLGMGGSKKLQDVFVDRKIPAVRRWGRPALVAGDQILWVPGVIRSRHRMVHWPETREILRIWVAYRHPEAIAAL